MRVDFEKQKRVHSAEKEVAERVSCHEGNCSTCLNAGEVSGDCKRQRRPNPKYFDYDAGDDSLMRPPISGLEPLPIPVASTRKARRSTAVVVSPRVTSGWGSHRRSGRTHRTSAAAVSQSKPGCCTRPPVLVSKAAPTTEGSPLDNLSIRELHEAFCSTYGRETSVKDKHWLKRQISAGWMMRQQDSAIIRSQSHCKLKARLSQSAQQPLPAAVNAAPVINTADIDRDAAHEAHVQGANEVEHLRKAFRNRLGNKCFQRRLTTPARGGAFGSAAAVAQTAIYGEVVNTGEFSKLGPFFSTIIM